MTLKLIEMNSVRYFTIYILLCFIFALNISKAQELKDKVVEVVKPYVPVVSDATKINILPEFNDTTIIKPSFKYQIEPRAINTDYQLNKINPAKMVATPLTKLYKDYLKFGAGIYSTVMAEAYINSLRSKDYTAGLFATHQSSGGKLKLDNNKKVFAGYSESDITIFAKRFFKKSLIYGNAGVKSNTDYQYGYNTRVDTVLEKGDIRQKCLTASVIAGFKSYHNDSSDLSYDFNMGYQYTQNRFKQSENEIRILVTGSKLYKKNLLGINTNLIHLKPDNLLDSTGYSNTIFDIKPFIILTSSDYRLEGGVNMIFENQLNKTSFYLYPDAELSFNIAKEVLSGFVGIKAYLKEHSYSAIFAENPFIKPNLLVKNTNVTSSLFGGLKGSLGSKAYFIAKADYSRIKNDYFFVSDTAKGVQNQFDVIYDNTNYLKLTFETNYDYSKSIAFTFKVNYNQYQLDFGNYAWNRPKLDVMFSTRYNLQNKILLDFDFFTLGKRFARDYDKGTLSAKELPSIFDINLGIEYRYTKILSIWLKFNNLTASRYYLWNYYPAQRFNMMAGITYSLSH